MSFLIRKAAVIGSGVMGAGIAAHLANAGIPCMLLDVKRDTAEKAIARLAKTNPAPLFRPACAGLIEPGELEAELPKLAEVDWVIEAVTERLDVKRELLARIESVWQPGTVVSTNTSGISVNAMVEGRGEAFRRHFLGTHFFNPPRYMKLLEIIPAQGTDPVVVEGIAAFGEKRLGKGVVVAKDTPNFVANRIGTYGMLVTLREMERGGFTVEEVDAATGPAMGRPKSATFRTLDLVGLDTFAHVAGNVRERASDPAEWEAFEVPAPLQALIARGWLGEKAGQGFYKKVKGPDGASVIQALNLATLEYADSRKPTSASLEAAKQAKGARGKLRALLGAGDRYSQLAWNLLAPVLLYSAERLGEIADSVVDIDNAMKWGFNWELGPFETWDAIGVRSSVARMQAEGRAVPAWVTAWLAAGNETFYKADSDGKRFYVRGTAWEEQAERKETISLRALKAQPARVIRSNAGASLIDIGDDVACLEFHSPNNAIGGDILTMITQSVEEVRRNWRGLVIANEGRNFCVGANLMLLLLEAQDEEWDEIDRIIRMFQGAMTALKRLERPVVAAPHRMTLGGGVEACLPADVILFASETYFGLVETAVGLIPAGGGCKELALRIAAGAASPETDLQPQVNAAFETVALAKTSTSGAHARDLGYMRAIDRVVMNDDHRIYEAKRAVLAMDEAGYTPQRPERVRVVGRDGAAVLRMGAYGMRAGGYISDHDLLIAGKLAHVLAGGDAPAGALVSEQYLLDLEREAFLSLVGEPKTQARMQHMLAKGKPLRN
ncbi:3-hydroxyacyl-CoA dehydrogenase/enoyl-CoA hydratase family protein [Paenibacillus sp.]|uniref:3-hydroxyacyl-CoA dehydrogenase/enoyl-CoA hydratase family protein n=1 Tax=Paenibacillus sp. TaxID=58172 RepID=UPI002D6487EE|nr:3-hydroxyacyl-CoA dehydrogenase NAD-binding domain-containing protein [Paenibacillus sp.]HZG88352.1 3-hydroxyacyl-CoA dehydrogenase NAD-binding domain-containing protein [Paenibacillus sp.]